MLSEKRWKPETVSLFFVLIFLGISLGGALSAVLAAAFKPARTDLEMLHLILGTISFHGIGLIAIGWFLRANQASWSGLLGIHAENRRSSIRSGLAAGLVGTPVAWALGALSAQWMEWRHLAPISQEPVRLLQETHSWISRAVIALVTVTAAPVVEEIVFRGILYPAVKELGYPRSALWGGSFLFAAIHSNAMALVPLFFLALVLTLLYEKTNNLLAPICAHSLFNLLNFFFVA